MSVLALLTETTVAHKAMLVSELRAGLQVDRDLALLLASPAITGQVVHIASDWLYETRATKTPGGDYLLMFPTNTRERPKGPAHYGHSGYQKNNDMVAFRSSDQGKTWAVGPNPRHGGWCVPQFNRMDEGRPINLGNGEIYMMIRTCEGHLWATRSTDDGKTWEAPAPTPLAEIVAGQTACRRRRLRVRG